MSSRIETFNSHRDLSDFEYNKRKSVNLNVCDRNCKICTFALEISSGFWKYLCKLLDTSSCFSHLLTTLIINYPLLTTLDAILKK